MYYKTSLEWFLIAFLLSIYGHVSTDKMKKTLQLYLIPVTLVVTSILVILTIPQSCMLIFSSKNQILGF